MKAILLAAGIGSRLAPLTESVPKCLVPIQDKPLLDYWLEMLTKHGDFEEIFINCHYLGSRVRSHIEEHWAHCPHIKLWHETKLLGTAGTLNQYYKEFCESTVMVIHADNLSFFNLNKFLLAHNQRPSNCLMTMMLFQTETPSSCGIVELDAENRVKEMHEKVTNPPGNLANAAVFFMEPEVTRWISENSVFDISKDVIPHFKGSIFTWKNNCYHRDIGTLKSYKAAQLDMSRGIKELTHYLS